MAQEILTGLQAPGLDSASRSPGRAQSV